MAKVYTQRLMTQQIRTFGLDDGQLTKCSDNLRKGSFVCNNSELNIFIRSVDHHQSRKFRFAEPSGAYCIERSLVKVYESLAHFNAIELH